MGAPVVYYLAFSLPCAVLFVVLMLICCLLRKRGVTEDHFRCSRRRKHTSSQSSTCNSNSIYTPCPCNVKHLADINEVPGYSTVNLVNEKGKGSIKKEEVQDENEKLIISPFYNR